MAAGFIAEWWTASNRNGGRLHVGKPGRNKSPTSSAFPSPCVTCRPAPASGTKSSIVCSRSTGYRRGKPLVSHQVIVQLIAATTTKTGLKVRCELDQHLYRWHQGVRRRNGC